MIINQTKTYPSKKNFSSKSTIEKLEKGMKYVQS